MMARAAGWIISFCFTLSALTVSAQEIDYSKPENVAMQFLLACKSGNLQSVPEMVIAEDRHRVNPEKLEKQLKHVHIPDEIKLRTQYSDDGKSADISVIGTKIGLELQFADGRWWLEH